MDKKIGYLGPCGTFSELAVRQYLARQPAGDVQMVALPSIYEVLAAVVQGEVTEAVVPLENSSEGAVNQTQDLLAHTFPDLRIKGEIILPVVHCLMAPPGVPLKTIERVLSHPHALAQCREFISRHLPGAQVVETASTAAAVHLVASTGAPWAAIGPVTAAREYGLEVLVEKINDCSGNATRFIVVGREDGGWAPDCKTTLIVSVAHRPGALYEVLGEFAARGINLTRIESRPSRRRLGEYLFFIDLVGHRHDKQVQEALEAVASRAELRVLGSYPADLSGPEQTADPVDKVKRSTDDNPGSSTVEAGFTGQVVSPSPVQWEEIERLREAIDEVDEQMVEMLARRNALVARIGKLKAGVCPVRDPHREARVLARVRRLAQLKGVDPAMVEKVYRLIIQHAVRLQREQQGGARAAFTPPAGDF
ncbi:prephenate dehydratase [Desulfofundulus sp. TPOSR]|uniref:prephenate dehydratase n=1 Tax=Desulfofundulus sp. TPOSR TaxID=2714340 RepID=UPI00140876EB|nr:prephenate dehydratase [Desulfofundulus sp. TPOSR]NHM27516.1 prephenate dehydratase [Desulfofundulus sp. TPOSR]